MTEHEQGRLVRHRLSGRLAVFSVIAVTTVGFGDSSPTTDASKLFKIVYILSGIAIIGVWLNGRLRRHGIVARRRRGGEA